MSMTVLLVMPVVAGGQTEFFDDQVEKAVESLGIDHNYSDIMEDIVGLSGDPVKINAATEEDDLGAIPFLTADQRKALLAYIRTYGEVFSIYELQSIAGFDSLLIRKIEPFIAICPPSHIPKPTLRNLARYGHHELLLRCEQGFPKAAGYKHGDSIPAGKQGSYYLGNPQRYYFRYSYNWFDKIRIGVAGEKDPGEQFFRGSQSLGMDFYSGYINLSNIGILKNLTIGNFKASFGQGLTFGSGLSLGSVPGFSVSVPAVKGIRPNLGMSEGSYLQGLAATFRIKPFEFSMFASYHPRDATAIPPDSISSHADMISSFTTTGYHRTAQELAKKNALRELVCGGNVNICMAPNQQLGFKIGLTGVYVRYSARLVPRVYPYNRFGFTGNENFNLGIDYQVRYRSIYLFGECSRGRNSSMALLAGAVITPDPRVMLTAIYRNYQPTCQDLFSNAFGQNSKNANERGIYASVNAALFPKLSLSAYGDLFTFPWLKYRVDSPSCGQEFGSFLSWQPARNATIGFRFWQKNIQVNWTAEPGLIMHQLTGQKTRTCQFTIGLTPGKHLSLQTRIEVKKVLPSQLPGTPGYFACEDVTVRPDNWISDVTFRFALFDVPVYDERIYVVEPDVLYGYSVPASQGHGIRTCMVVKFRAGRKFEIWLRGGLVYYTDRAEVGTGPDMTEGNTQYELTGQLLVRM